MWTAIMAVFAAIMGGITAAMNANSQRDTNAANIQASKDMAEQQQEYARENAATANAETERMYWELYSPQAKVQQYKDAGLSVGLMYGGGGTGGQSTAQMAPTPSQTAPYLNPVVMPNILDQIMAAAGTSKEMEKTDAEIGKIDKEVNVMDAQISEINAKITNFEADTGLKLENTNFVKVQSITEQWKAENAKLEADFNANTMQTRKEILDKTLDKIYQEITESERRVMGMDIDQDQKTKMFGLEQARIIAETTKAQAEAARSMAEKVNAEIEKQILIAQQQGANDQLEILKEQKEQAKKQTKILEEQVKQSETASKMADWEYSVRWWTKINETLGALAGVANSASNVTRAVKMPQPKQ